MQQTGLANHADDLCCGIADLDNHHRDQLPIAQMTELRVKFRRQV